MNIVPYKFANCCIQCPTIFIKKHAKEIIFAVYHQQVLVCYKKNASNIYEKNK